MNEVIKNIIERRAIRRYKPEQIKDEELQQILEAGLWGASAGGRQSAVMLVCQNGEINEKIGRINRSIFGPALKNNLHSVNEKQISIAEDDSIKSGFYGAPTVVTVFAPKNFRFSINDATIVADNMMLAAWSLGIGSVHVGRSEETFETEEGKKLMEEAGIDPSYAARVSVCLGYPDGEIGQGKSRKIERIYFIK
jgi:nitroreductase